MAALTFDTNVLIYAVDVRDPRQAAAIAMLSAGARRGAVLTLQALGEFFAATTRKRLLPAPLAQAQIAAWQQAFGVPVVATPACLALAMEGAALGRFQFWDAMLLATAGAGGCSAVISEDMAPGARLGAVQVVRAFDGGAIAPEAASLLG